MAKVSILMPACNVEKYIDECMKSITSQTLEDIEIVVVNDGSKDETGRILDRYAYEDERVKVIHKPNGGYGHTMNVALACATGEYVGVLETDDWCEPDMYENLYGIAKEHDADVVRSNFYRYWGVPEPKDEFVPILERYDLYDQIFSPEEHQDVLRTPPYIWTGLYRRSMLIENGIHFTETPGASYQDTSYAFQVWVCAQRVYFTSEAYLHYRQDNMNSSVKAPGKVFCVCDEYAESERFLAEHPQKQETFAKMKNAIKYETYRWNLQRLSFGFKYAFLLRIKEEFAVEEEKGLLDESLFPKNGWKNLMRILHDTDAYYNEVCCRVIRPYATVEEAMEELKDCKEKLKPKKEKMKDNLKEHEQLYRTLKKFKK